MFEANFLSGETAVVTGASRGIGESIARKFAECGANVALAARSTDALDELAADIESTTDVDAVAVPTDVREEADVMELARRVEAFGDGTVDILVANAGANFHAPAAEMSLNAWKTIVDINLNGTFLCCRAFADALAAADGGNVVTLSSVYGRDGEPGSSHYASSKAGIETFTRTLAMEWADRNVRVNCVRPGIIATPGVEENLGITADELNRSTVSRNVGAPREIADLVLFLVSGGASYVTGQTYTAEGVPSVPR